MTFNDILSIMNQSLEVIIKGEVAEIYKLFEAYFGIKITFTTSEPREIMVLGKGFQPSRFCTLLQKYMKIGPKCAALDECKRREAAVAGHRINYYCHSGLLECIIPIFLRKTLLGFFVIGQIRTSDKMYPGIQKAWNNLFNPRELEDAFLALPYIPPEKVEYLLELFSILIRYITSRQLVVMQGDEKAGKLESYMLKHLHEKISLIHMAGEMQKSPSALSQTFRRKFGKPFKRMLIEERIARFEEQKRTDPGMSIRQAAENAGFDDPYYFSRIYKKYRGFPPSHLENEERKTV